jgi:NAD(P)-dependent dehydrogenase (short-subunit alcohol dehydrogenase family)
MTQHRITSPFTAASTAAEVTAGIDLGGKQMIVTGGSSGIGVETARALASAGAAVTVAVCDTDAGCRVAAEINSGLGREAMTAAPLDLMDLESVRRFSAAWGATRCTP